LLSDIPFLLLWCVIVQAPGDEPVWRQILLRHVAHRDPALAQQATAALAE
jgi:hypothetical protein